MMTLTVAAARQIHAAGEDGAAGDLGLRVAARRMADGTIDYAMGFDEQREGDLVLDEKGVRLLIGKPSVELLEGTQIDYVEYQPGDFRFIFVPPESREPAAAQPPG
jgi:iron-sulfur cluster assembly protein